MRVHLRRPIVPWSRLFPALASRARATAGASPPRAPNRWVATPFSRTAGKPVASPEIDGKPGKSVASPPQRISFVSLARKRTIE
jgi:hypothetical protein